MRKQTKLVAVLSAAALLAIGASMTSFAANGWTEEDGTWVYLDNDGYRVTDTWKKSGNFWYYLDEDGYMATSKLIENGDTNDNTYYVDETGRMVANKWVELQNENYYDSSDDEEEPETVWYYFQNSGKAYKTSGKVSWKTINGKKYNFDENGHMVFGWVDADGKRLPGDDGYKTAMYYCGDSNDGARVTSDWRYLYIGTENRNNDMEDDTFWFYFDTTGKKIATDAAELAKITDPDDVVYKTKKINGKTYAFDEEGKMISKWSESTAGMASRIDGYFSTSDDGARKKGWFQAVPAKTINSKANADEDNKWFYANNDGSLIVNKLKTINNKKYAFNEKGEMLSGVWYLQLDNDYNILDTEEIDTVKEVDEIHTFTNGVDVTPTGIYYFGASDDGSMKTGAQNVEIDGDKYQFAFIKSGANKGRGVDAVQGNILYVNGKRVKADSDYRYQIVDTDGLVKKISTVNGTEVGYLVNTSGSVMKGTGIYTDADGRQYTVKLNADDKTYTITYKGFKK